MKEDLKLGHLHSWPVCFSVRLGWRVPRGCPLEVGAGRKVGFGGKKFAEEDRSK